MANVSLAQFHQVFFEESLEGLDAMETALLALDEGGDKELVHTIFRAAHSIKGGAATFGFPEMAAFTHEAESLLDEVRDGRRAIDKRDRRAAAAHGGLPARHVRAGAVRPAAERRDRRDG